MKPLVKFYIFCIILFSACSNTTFIKLQPVHTTIVKKINHTGKNRTGTILLKDGNIFTAENIYIFQDSLYFNNLTTDKHIHISLSNLSRISFDDHFVGLTQGFFIGAGMGALGGWLKMKQDQPAEMEGLLILGGLISGGLIGAVIGVSTGSTIDFDFNTINAPVPTLKNSEP